LFVLDVYSDQVVQLQTLQWYLQESGYEVKIAGFETPLCISPVQYYWMVHFFSTILLDDEFVVHHLKKPY